MTMPSAPLGFWKKEEHMQSNGSQIDQHRRNIELALTRAAGRAEKIARATGTPLVLWEDGRVVEVQPEQPANACPVPQATAQTAN